MTSWFVNCAKDNQRHYTKQGSESLLQSECRRMELQTDLVTLKRDQRLRRAVWLQSRWLELSEMERRAQLQNRQLLQAFDRAQDTLRDMVTRTAAMNTIRVEYEHYLEESYPRWQQQLNEKKLLAQRKRRDQQLKESLRRMEEDLEEERVPKHSKEAQTSLSSSHVHIPQNTSSPQDKNRQNGHGDYIQDGSILSHIQSSWLVQAHSQLADYQNRMPYNCQRGDLSHQPSVLFQPYDPQSLSPIQPYPVQQPPRSYSTPTDEPHIMVRQATLPTGYPMPLPSVVAAVGHPFISSRNPQTSWTSPSMPDTHGRRMVEGEDKNSEEQEVSAAPSPAGESAAGKTQRAERRKHLAHELDFKPVRLSTDSSRSSSQASKESIGGHGGRARKEKRGTPGSGEASVSPSLVQTSEADESSPEAQGKVGIRQCLGLANTFRPEGPESRGEESTGQRASGGQRGVTSYENVTESNVEATEMEEKCLAGGSREDGGTGEEDELEHKKDEEEVDGGGGAGRGERDRKEPADDEQEASERERQEEGEEEEENRPISGESSREQERGEEEQDSECQGDTQERKMSDGAMEEESENEREESSLCHEGGVEETAEGREGEERAGEETEDDEEGGEEEEQRSQGEPDNEEEHDSDDSIISPPGHRLSKVLAEEEEEEEMISDNDDYGDACRDDKAKGYSWSADPCPDEDDDIEILLAPIGMSQGNKEEEKKEKAVIKTRAIREDIENVSEVKAVDKKTKANQETESDEFDHFYD